MISHRAIYYYIITIIIIIIIIIILLFSEYDNIHLAQMMCGPNDGRRQFFYYCSHVSDEESKS